MNKKIILGVVLLGAGAAYMFKDKLFGNNAASLPSSGNKGGNTNNGGANTDTGMPQVITGNPYEGMVVRSPGNDEGWYRVLNGKRVVYQSIDGYTNDGSRVIVDLPLNEFNQIPKDTLQYIASSGKLTRW